MYTLAESALDNMVRHHLEVAIAPTAHMHLFSDYERAFFLLTSGERPHTLDTVIEPIQSSGEGHCSYPTSELLSSTIASSIGATSHNHGSTPRPSPQDLGTVRRNEQLLGRRLPELILGYMASFALGAASTVFESEPPFEHNGQPFDPTEDLIRKPGPLSPELQANYQTCLDYFRKSKPLNAEDKRRVIDLYTERYILLADDLIALWDVHGNRLPLTVVKENNTEKNKQPLSRS